MNPLVQFIKTHPLAQLPSYSHALDVGADICVIENFSLRHGSTLVVDTGLTLAYCDPSFEIQIRSRSGLAANHGIRIVNSPGTIDPGYRGPIKLILTKDNHGNIGRSGDFLYADETHFKAGDRLAQLVIAPRYRANFQFTEIMITPTEDTRFAGGFGSTGV